MTAKIDLSLIRESLSLEEMKDESHIIAKKLLINGQQELIHHRTSTAPIDFENQMDKEGNSTLHKILKRYFQQQWQQIPFDWFNTFITKQSQDGDRYYQQVLKRTTEFGQKYMREYPVFSIVLQLVFIFNDDDTHMDETIFDQVWNTFAMEGCKTALKRYFVSTVMKECSDSLNNI